jgi:two-component system sensor histidine kinase ArlS
MRISSKINLMTTSWILFVLLAINAIVFFSFMHLTVNIEEEGINQKVQSILQEIQKSDTSTGIEEKLAPFLTNHSFIRIINRQSQIVNEVTNDKHYAAKIKGEFSSKRESERYIIRLAHGEEQMLVVRVPIKSNGQVVDSLEIGERLLGLELGKDVLLSILAFCTVLGAVLSLLGGKLLSNIIMRPISNMINTMEDIEQSGITKRIDIQHETKDELQKMAVTFNRMIGRLDANLEKQKQFISDASHEMKTPLTVIKSYADLLRRRGIKNEAITLDAIESIHSEATRMQKMTERFLDLANTELENVLEYKSINLVVLCQNILKQLKGAYKRDIFLHYIESPLTVTGDELKIKQVIIILLDNAIKYSDDKIDLFLTNNDQNVVIRVKDNGIGIPENEQENIFERFYRVDKARNRETGGTGLGLSIARNIMKQHNGEIKVISTHGIGTEVELVLPKIKHGFH